MRVLMADNNASFPWSSLSHKVERYKTCLQQQLYDSWHNGREVNEKKQNENGKGTSLVKPQLTCQQDKPLNHYQAAEPELQLAAQETKLREKIINGRILKI